MVNIKRVHPKEKANLHPRNKHRQRYDFETLIKACPELSAFVKLNAYEDYSIDFSNAEAVKMLNKALLKCYYDIEYWDIPAHYLCPPIPGRADYIHYLADLLSASNNGRVPTGNHITCLDIGVGANCVYPIIGVSEYQWSFIGADIDPVAVISAKAIVENNHALQGKIEIRMQSNKNDFFIGIIRKDELIDMSLCNPPFHASAAEARSGSLRKITNLTGVKTNKPNLNFSGQNNELWCEGGEQLFVMEMIRQSKQFTTSCFWFTSLISKKENLKTIYAALDKAQAVEVKTIEMSQGNKISRFIAWTFLSVAQQKMWAKSRWQHWKPSNPG